MKGRSWTGEDTGDKPGMERVKVQWYLVNSNSIKEEICLQEHN